MQLGRAWPDVSMCLCVQLSAQLMAVRAAVTLFLLLSGSYIIAGLALPLDIYNALQ